MDETNTVVPEPEAVTLESATNVFDFWRQRALRAEERLDQASTVLAAEQRDRKAAETEAATLHQQLATVTALVPEVDWLEQAAVMAWHHCESCPVENDGCRGRKREDWTCKMLQARLRNLAARIRAWRGDGGEEQGGESDGD